MRAALYARYSTDQQRAASIADQLHACRKLAAQLGATVVREYSDAAISGALTVNRPGLQGLLALAEAGQLDLVICEHTDRLSRAGGDTYHLYDDLAAWGVRIVTVNQGEVGTVQVGAAALMSSLFMEEHRKKVRRGLEGVVRAGGYTGQPAYGYRAKVAYDAAGERVRGQREILEPEAEVVRRIFQDTANGLTVGEIVAALNAEGVPTRNGRLWSRAALYGRVDLPTGILRNELYRGQLVWGRLAKRKDRRTGRAKAIANPAELQRRAAPELRIVSDELWAAAQDKLAARAMGARQAPRGSRRGPTLLGGLIRCGCCGGRMVKAGPQDLIRCGARALYGEPCPNGRTPSYAAVQDRVLAAVQANLLHPAVVEAAAAEWIAAEREARLEANRGRAELERQLADADRRAARLIQQVEEGMPWSAAKDRHAELEAKAADLRQQLAALDGPAGAGEANVVTLIPSAATLYRKAVAEVADITRDPTDRHDAAAREAVRALIDEIRIFPREGRGQVHVELTANLAPIFAADEAMRVASFGLNPSRSHSPWQVKLTA